MPHPLVTQLRFTRSEWIRGLKAVTAEEAARRFGPINPIAWMIGHLAWQEQLYWLERAQGITRVPEVKRFELRQAARRAAARRGVGVVARRDRRRRPVPGQPGRRQADAALAARVIAGDAGDQAPPHDLPLLVPPERVAGRATDARAREAARLRRRLRGISVPAGDVLSGLARVRERRYSVPTTSAGHARASTRACHSLILPSRSITTPTRCAPFWGSTLAP
ncbi:MAG: hypothetical protein DMD96_17300 [Candidatus Rokuibacteriota bacterium]|nr:MAG: hypothetical protein DMD96_17300 [Candidatus Rokubacteria bacterium]